MKWLNPILRHGVVVIVVIAIAIAFAYRQQLFPMFFSQPATQAESSQTATGQKTDEASKEVPAAPTTEAGKEIPAAPIAKTTPMPDSTAASATPQSLPDDQAKAGFESGALSAPPVQQQGPTQKMMDDNRRADISGSTQTAPRSPAPAPSQRPMPAQPFIPAQPHAPARPPVPPVAQQPGESQPMPINRQPVDKEKMQNFILILNNARHAYWQREMDKAEKAYQQAIRLMPDVADTYGELGNLYYSQGEWQKAGEAFYQAAVRLLDTNRVGKAYHLMTILRGLAPERAEALQKKATKMGLR